MKNILYILITMAPLFCYANDGLILPNNNVIKIDTLLLKKEILRLTEKEKEGKIRNIENYNLTLSDTSNFQIVDMIKVYIDTINNNINLEIDKDKQLIFFFAHNSWYEIDNVEKRLSQKKIVGASFRLSEIVERDIERVYYIPSLFTRITKSENNNLLCFKLKECSETFVFDSEGMLYSSFQSYINHSFGSLEGYINTYNYRIKNSDKNFKLLQEFILNNPKIRSYDRIRGGK